MYARWFSIQSCCYTAVRSIQLEVVATPHPFLEFSLRHRHKLSRSLPFSILSILQARIQTPPHRHYPPSLSLFSSLPLALWAKYPEFSSFAPSPFDDLFILSTSPPHFTSSYGRCFFSSSKVEDPPSKPKAISYIFGPEHSTAFSGRKEITRI